MKPIIDITQIRLQTLVYLEEAWGKTSWCREALKGVSDLVPLHGHFLEENLGDMQRSLVRLAHKGKLVHFPPEKDTFIEARDINFDKDAALAHLRGIFGVVLKSAVVLGAECRSPKQTVGGYPYQRLRFRFIAVSEADYEHFVRESGALVTLRGDYESALERDMDIAFEDVHAA
jgi:hypothetical protein